MADLTVGSGGTYSTLSAAIAAATASDRILVLNTQAESISGAVTLTVSTTTFPEHAPLQILCVSSFGTPALSTGGGYSWTTNFGITFNGNFYIYGLAFTYTGSGANPTVSLGTSTSQGRVRLDNCNINIQSSGSTAKPLRLGAATGSASNDAYRCELNNCNVAFGNAAQSISVGAGNHAIENLTVSGTLPSYPFAVTAGTGASILALADSDLSSKAFTGLMDGSQAGQLKLSVSNVKLHTTTQSNPFGASAVYPYNELTAVNVGTTDSSVLFTNISGQGTVATDTTVYATTNPLTDSGTSISRKLTSASTCGFGAPLKTELLLPVADNATITPYIEILVGADGAAALKDNECWIDVQAITTDGSTIGTIYTTYPGILASGTNLSAGTTSYTGDGYTTERTHKIALASSITVRQDSLIKITVNLAKPSTVVYVGNYGG